MTELRTIDALAVFNLDAVFSRWRGSDVFALTYTFDLPFFEAHLLPKLINGCVDSITVAADARWLRERLPQWVTANEVRHAGSSNLLAGIEVPGTFHPKIVRMTDESHSTMSAESTHLS